MKRLEFTCDGCDLIKHITLPPGGNADFALQGWVAHRLVAHENGSQAHEIFADLCPQCSEKMRHAINPANWPRMDPNIKQFAKKSAS